MSKGKINKKMLGIAITLLCIVVELAFASYAWFCNNGYISKITEDLKIDKPPIIYILDSDGADMYQLNLSGMAAGSTKQIVLCISQSNPVTDDSPVSSGSFRIALAHTNNLGASFSLYAATAVAQGTPGAIEYFSQPNEFGVYHTGYFTKGNELSFTQENEEANKKAYGEENYATITNSVVNVVTYQIYVNEPSNSADSNYQALEYGTSSGTGIMNPAVCRFYFLEVDVPVTGGGDSKEVDMIYIIARGGS